MKQHPFIEHIRYRVLAALILVLAVILQACLFSFYEGERWYIALPDSLASTLVFAVLGYFAWYTVGLLDELYKQTGIILLVQLLCLSASHVVLMFISPESLEWFMLSLPLRILFGVLAWIVLYQWYRLYLKSSAIDETLDTMELSEVTQKEEQTAVDRISVKDGTRIHLIPVEELVYVEASGDYVTLFTTDKQYIKEQTMKSLVLQLPSEFIRIHRSVIVNCNFIARIELFEKQSYRIRLKNGFHLKVSAAGYRLLKEKLLL